MSNVKVRIYELSKELNLDNKDILDICEQLNIAVKSHSSTITESEAERIKITAEKYHHQHQRGKAHGGHASDAGHGIGERKQEILAIHHRQNDSFPPSNTQTLVKIEKPVLVEPQRPSMTSQPPTMPITPSVTPLQEEAMSPTIDSNVALRSQETKTQSPAAHPKEQKQKEHKSKNNQKSVTVSDSDVSKQQLLRPPVRPPEKPLPVKEEKLDKQPAAQQTSTKEKEKDRDKEKSKPHGHPKPKGNKEGKKQDRSPKSDRHERPSKPEKTNKPERKASEPGAKKEPREPRENREPREPRENREHREPRERREHKTEIKATVELKRPVPPKPPQKIKPELVELPLDDESEDLLVEEEILEEDGLDIDKPKQKPKLKRPTPPHASKRGAWEEEEEEERDDGKGKAAKATKGAKGKRRQALLDDDEDFESDLSELLEVSESLSLSTARPPKPKSMEKAATSGFNGHKGPRMAVKTEAGAATRTKFERRERKEEKERPDAIVLEGSLTVRELSERLALPETEIIKNLFFKGIAVNITQTLDLDTIQMLLSELGVKIETPEERAAAAKTTEMIEAGDLENLQRRPPVVTIMGHVDHGKTTLLDSIRKTKVAQGEAGGITQHIGAYHVDIEHNGQQEQIVFLDTPGHEAFTAMRARGARVTDIAVLVVAADDGVQPQTREAVSHARAAGVPIVVAINKVDKLDSNPDRIKQELAELSLVSEEWGGETIMVPVSALKGDNLDNLLEMILLVAEIEELSANPDRTAKGTVIEAHLDRTRGPVATLLVQNGTLRVGDTIVAGSVLGKIRAMIDDRGEKVEDATPSFAVEILGLNDVPAAGDEFEVYENEKEARQLADQRSQDQRQHRLQQAMSSRRVSLTTLSAQAQEGKLKELNLILKADVQGSAEAIIGSLQQLPQKEVQIRVLLAAAGEITETDVDLAAASGAVVVGFNTTLASGARHAADREGVDIREYNIIYKLLDDIQGAMEGLLDPEEVEEHLGVAEVRAVFSVGRGAVAGCYVLSGKIIRNRLIRVRRKGEVVYEGTLESLKRMKEDAREVNAGYECGIGVSKFNEWQEGDLIEVYEMVMKRRTLSTN